MTNRKSNALASIIKVAAILALMSISACSYARPNARILNQAPQAAPANYKLGWKDGCESGMALTGNQLYKAVYHNKIDVSKVNDTQYYRGWNEAKTYCAHYTMATQWEGGVLPKTPTEERKLLPEPQGIFSVVSSWGSPTLVNFWGNANQEQEVASRGLDSIFY
jgi:hypothetical protein